MPVDIRDMQDFVAVLAAGSILKAAEQRGIAQPALSRRIRALEESLGVPLLKRTSQGVAPTPYGELLAQHARRLIHARDQAVTEVSALGQGLVGHLRIGVGPAVSTALAEAVATISRRHPQLSFTIVEGTFEMLADEVRAARIDCAFCLLPPNAPPKGLRLQNLIRTRIGIVGASNHPLNRSASGGNGGLADVQWAMLNSSPWTLDALGAHLKSLGFDPMSVAVQTDSLDVLKSLLLRSQFLTVLPLDAVSRELNTGCLAIIQHSTALPEASAFFIHPDEVVPPALQNLADVMKAELEAT